MTSPDRSETIDITRYAEVIAHLRHFPADKHAEVIARLGIRRRDWDAASAKWRRVRDNERVTGQLEVTVRFGRVLADTRAKLDARRPDIESLGPFPGPDGAPVETPARAPARAALEGTPVTLGVAPADANAPPAPAVQVPSYVAAELRAAAQALLPPPPDAPPSRRPNHLASTVLGASAPVAATLPFSAPAASTVETYQRALEHADAVQGPVASRRGAIGSATVGVGNEGAAPVLPPGVADLTLEQYASLRVELETAPERAAATLSRYGVSVEGRAPLDAYWKARFAADPLLEMTFARGHVNYTAWLKANPPAGASQPAPRSGPSTQSSAVGAAPPFAATMPFSAPAVSTAETYQRALAHAASVQGPPEVRHGAVGSGTVAAGAEGVVAPLPPGVPALTLEQYASLRVERETRPDQLAAILDRYGVPADGREALDAYWKARFSADPVLGMTFARTYAGFVAWFKTNPGI